MRLFTLIILISFYGFCHAGTIFNGDFEFYDPNGTEWFDPAVGWNYINYAGVHQEFIPIPENGNHEGKKKVKWMISSAVHGDSFAIVSTGDMGLGSDSAIIHSQMSQQVTLDPGDHIHGNFYFGTCDWYPYNDIGIIELIALDPNNTDPNYISLASITIKDVGDFSSSETWQFFSYEYTGITSNDYFLNIRVKDVNDSIYKSYLAVDHLGICGFTDEDGDFNMDCSIDLADFSILSQGWLGIPSDPNSTPGIEGTILDLDNDNFIGIGDLKQFEVQWFQ